MAIVRGLDQHRAQITAEWIDTDTDEISRHQTPARRRLQRGLEALTGGRAPLLQALRARVWPALRAVEELRAIGAGLAAGHACWDNQDVWTVGDNGWATLVAGFTASTTGVLAGVTAALFSTNSGGSAEQQPAPAQG